MSSTKELPRIYLSCYEKIILIVIILIRQDIGFARNEPSQFENMLDYGKVGHIRNSPDVTEPPGTHQNSGPSLSLKTGQMLGSLNEIHFMSLFEGDDRPRQQARSRNRNTFRSSYLCEGLQSMALAHLQWWSIIYPQKVPKRIAFSCMYFLETSLPFQNSVTNVFLISNLGHWNEFE